MGQQETGDQRVQARSWLAMGLLVVLLATIACRQPAVEVESEVSGPADDWVVEVQQSGSIVGSGFVTGDGSQVLTVLAYGTDIPVGLEVVTGSGVRYPATIKTFHPGTGATLLELQGANLPVGTPGDDRDISDEQPVVMQGWLANPDSVVTDGLGNIILSGETGMTRTIGNAHNPHGTPLMFRISYSLSPYSMVASSLPGTVVTDTDGNILGLAGNLTWGLGYYRTTIGAIPSIIGINSILELLADDFPERPEAKGPTGYSVFAAQPHPAYPELPRNYQAWTDAVRELLGGLGEPVDDDYLSKTYLRFGNDRRGGNLLVLEYVWPVELRNQSGELLAKVRRVTIAWDRPADEPDIVYYTEDESGKAYGFMLLNAVDALNYVLFLPEREIHIILE